MHQAQLQKNDRIPQQSRAPEFILQKIARYLSGFEQLLDQYLDKRLVRTFHDLFIAILLNRNHSTGLLLSELGGFICGFAHAPAGTKRISNLLRSNKWTHRLLDQFLFERSKQRIEQLRAQGKRVLMLWDDSRVEKPESWFMEGLCSVESSKGKRLTKIKKGFYRPPSSRICVPGFHWTATLLSCLGEPPSVCQMSWWTTRGKHREMGTNIIFRMLRTLQATIGPGVLHVLDRGYANAWTIEWFTHFQQDFLVRWKKNHLLVEATRGKKQTHLLARSFKPRHHKIVWDSQRKLVKHISVAWAQVQHPEFEHVPLWLVIVRDKKHHQAPLYLLTSVEITGHQQAWEMCHSYLHRWNIEQAFRFCKTELAMESPRLWFFENTCKLLGIVALIYDFLLTMLRLWACAVRVLVRKYGHRTGNRYRKASIPIYRLRAAISLALWVYFAQSSG